MNINELNKFNEELDRMLNEAVYSNLDAIVFDINKILAYGARAILKSRVPKDLKEDGVDFIIEIKAPNNCLYQWGIYPNNEFLLCNWYGSFRVKDEYENNPERYSPTKFVNDIFEKYGYKWAKTL